WDLAAVHRLLAGEWRADAGRVWAGAHGLDTDSIPVRRPPDLFHQAAADDQRHPVRPDGHLHPQWLEEAGPITSARLATWAQLALEVAQLQHSQLRGLSCGSQASATARAESAAELLCAELEFDGLPLDRSVAERIIADSIGPRPSSEIELVDQRNRRDAEVLCHAPPGGRFDLRSPADVRSLLRRIGIEVPDTRAWRLEAIVDPPPLVTALLAWRKAERVASTYGYTWLDNHLGADSRLRGSWSGSDGAAGRMTASAGLHNMPAEMRPAVVAENGRVFVRADLGQIEPRVLAAVSGDPLLAAATAAPDLYAPIAEQLGVARSIAKVAVLGAMYGQTTGRGADALRSLDRAYPVAMTYLREASVAGRSGRNLRTFGGRLIRLDSSSWVVEGSAHDDRESRTRDAARGRYARNAMVQGAAAELFKVWAALVRARCTAFDARIVLCLHDELLVHAPIEHAAAVAEMVGSCLQEAAARWSPDRRVRFVADISIIARWSDVSG
ncbi:MAG: DNA polymerase, partial [Ilumatobacteraceae bacterium]